MKDISTLVGLERYAKRTGEDIITLPFFCEYCKMTRMDFEMVDGDGFLMCSKCFDIFVDALSPKR